MDIAEPHHESQLKRKRSSSVTNNSATQANSGVKVPKLASGNSLSINYLARSSNEDLPLIHKEEPLPSLLHLLSLYTSVLDRQESLASNLGARPLGPILIKRFERCFDAPPKIVASHHKSATSPEDANLQITWLEVIEFARSHPHQFTLSTFSEGRRVCQFYYPQRQLRVQITEEDFLFIRSGRCQELIPPLPIWEDEEKEVSTCEVLEARLKELTNAADMVAARTRQLSHRLKGRKAAILERRAEGGSGTPARVGMQQTTTAPPSAATGFVAVNGTRQDDAGHSSSVRQELLRHFESLPQNQTQPPPRSSSRPDPDALHGFRTYDSGPSQPIHGADVSSVSPFAGSPAAHDSGSSHPSMHNPSGATATTTLLSGPSSAASTKHNFSRPLPPALESTQPFRPLCQAHMDALPRGTRVKPPCDRCRRLHMDCVKNLTSCAGCTKKHARCHWKNVSMDEVGALDHLMESAYAASGAQSPVVAQDDGEDVVSAQDQDTEGEHEDDEHGSPPVVTTAPNDSALSQPSDTVFEHRRQAAPPGDKALDHPAMADTMRSSTSVLHHQGQAQARITTSSSLPALDFAGTNHDVRSGSTPQDGARAGSGSAPVVRLPSIIPASAATPRAAAVPEILPSSSSSSSHVQCAQSETVSGSAQQPVGFARQYNGVAAGDGHDSAGATDVVGGSVAAGFRPVNARAPDGLVQQ